LPPGAQGGKEVANDRIDRCAFSLKIRNSKDDSRYRWRSKGEPVLGWTKQGLLFNLYLMKVRFLFLKFFVIKELRWWAVRQLHRTGETR
jgi:hypothetical protein